MITRKPLDREEILTHSYSVTGKELRERLLLNYEWDLVLITGYNGVKVEEWLVDTYAIRFEDRGNTCLTGCESIEMLIKAFLLMIA